MKSITKAEKNRKQLGNQKRPRPEGKNRKKKEKKLRTPPKKQITVYCGCQSKIVMLGTPRISLAAAASAVHTATLPPGWCLLQH
jgi:hypothetical protein